MMESCKSSGVARFGRETEKKRCAMRGDMRVVSMPLTTSLQQGETNSWRGQRERGEFGSRTRRTHDYAQRDAAGTRRSKSLSRRTIDANNAHNIRRRNMGFFSKFEGKMEDTF